MAKKNLHTKPRLTGFQLKIRYGLTPTTEDIGKALKLKKSTSAFSQVVFEPENKHEGVVRPRLVFRNRNGRYITAFTPEMFIHSPVDAYGRAKLMAGKGLFRIDKFAIYRCFFCMSRMGLDTEITALNLQCWECDAQQIGFISADDHPSQRMLKKIDTLMIGLL